jgi:hypothetical protein
VAALVTSKYFLPAPPVYADGTRYRSTPNETPANWEKLDVTRLADRLTGHLLIIYADMDEDALPKQAFRMVGALTRANKPYHLIYLQNRTHRGGPVTATPSSAPGIPSLSTCAAHARGISRSRYGQFILSDAKRGYSTFRERRPSSRWWVRTPQMVPGRLNLNSLRRLTS